MSLVTQAPWQDFLLSKNSFIGVDDEVSAPSQFDSVQPLWKDITVLGKQIMEKLFDRVQKTKSVGNFTVAKIIAACAPDAPLQTKRIGVTSLV